jgi:gamma-D-glutamyl-L-lysine dipeptidyl-peptidase
MGKRALLLTLLLAAGGPLKAEDGGPLPMYVVAAPLADVRAEPKRVDGAAALRAPYAQDPLQETQLLFGERVKLLVDKDPWVLIEAVEQPEYTHAEAWTGYPGWVLKSAVVPEPAGYAPNAVVAVPYAKMTDGPSRRDGGVLLPAGSRLAVTFQKDAWVRVQRPDGKDGWMARKDVRLFAELPATDAARRASILEAARRYLAEPYYWGGRAGHRTQDIDVPSGMDCSGLVNVAYRVSGVDVPRDSHEQFMRAASLPSSEALKPGDLIFLSRPKDPERITHVMIYAGGDDVIEAVQEQNVVRQVSVKEKLGVPLSSIAAVLTPVGDRSVYFGRLLPE